MFNRKADFIRNEKIGDDDGTPVFRDTIIFGNVPVRSEQMGSDTEQPGETGSSVRIRRKLMVKPKVSGIKVEPSTDMQVVIDGKVHDITGVKPVEGGSPKPVYIEVIALERLA